MSLRAHNLKIVEKLEPSPVWKYFAYLSAIPRTSGHEERASLFVQEEMKAWMQLHNFSFESDHAGNFLYRVPATTGFEHVPGIAIQSHLDMVCEKDMEYEHDCLKDGIVLAYDKQSESLHARNTSLGADNGIAVAMAMSLAQELSKMEHGQIELLFTVEEEIGLRGVQRMKDKMLKSKILINLDTFEEGTLLVGCAGGRDTHASFAAEYAESDESVGSYLYNLSLTGLLGGHSGHDILLPRANSIKLLSQLLQEVLLVTNGRVHVSHIEAGSKRNAIPRDATVTLHLHSEDVQTLKDLTQNFPKQHFGENVTISIESRSGLPANKPYSTAFLKRILTTIDSLPTGIIEMQSNSSVKTSTNLAVLLSDDTSRTVNLTMMTRSLYDSSRNATCLQIRSTLELAKATEIIDEVSMYPSWTPNTESTVVKHAILAYQKLFETKPNITTLHVGVEPAVIGAKHNFELDMVSIGPDIRDAHSPRESVHVHSVAKIFKYLKRLVAFISEMEKI